MKFLYIIGNGSLYNNEELRFSLRGLDAHVKEPKDIIIVGEKVHFLSDKVDYHYLKEEQGNKEYRIATKILNAIKKGYVKGNFIFMNDDFFFTRPYNFRLNYAKADLKHTSLDNYQKAIFDTKNYLTKLGYSTYHFDVHTPIIYNAKKFLALEPHFEQSRLSTNGFVVKSLYGNIYGLKPTLYTDCKLNTLQTPRDYERAQDAPILSCSDSAWSNGVRSYLKNLYPNKSKYEI